MSVDPKVFELAKFYLSDEPELDTPAACDTLAWAIQQCIEDEIIFMREMMEKV